MTVERDAIEQVYREHGDRLWRALLGFTGDPEIASDALAEALAQALVHKDDLHSPADWVWASAFRIARGFLKDRTRKLSVSIDQQYDLAEPVRDLVLALAQISERQRLAIVLHDYGDRSTADVAEMLGISTATVYVHLSEGRKQLRKLLEDDDE